MESLKKYTQQNIQPINEMATLIVGLICGPLLLHYGFKLLHGIGTCCDAFWKWVFDESRIEDTSNFVFEKKQITKQDVENLQPMQIPNEHYLKKIVDTSNPTLPSKKTPGKGLYAFNELLLKEPKLSNVNKAPYYPMYCAFISHGESKDRKDIKIVGVAGFSTRYFSTRNNAVSNIDKRTLAKYKKCMHIIIWQSDPQYARNGLAQKYLEILKDAAKETHSRAITIQTPEDTESREAYEALGFLRSEELRGYMILQLNDIK